MLRVALVNETWGLTPVTVLAATMGTQTCLLFAIDGDHKPEAREVKLIVDAALHQQRAQQSQAAMLQTPTSAPKTNMVVVTGQPQWYATYQT